MVNGNYLKTTAEPTTTVDVSDSSYSKGLLVANLEGNVTGQVSDISNHDTGIYLKEQINISPQARARGSVSVTDSGGDGSLAYEVLLVS